jgi:hypothetical protein
MLLRATESVPLNEIGPWKEDPSGSTAKTAVPVPDPVVMLSDETLFVSKETGGNVALGVLSLWISE